MVASATLRPRTSNPYAAFRRRAFCVSVDRGMRHDGITFCDADQECRRRDRGEFPDRRRSYLLRSGSGDTTLRSSILGGFPLPKFHITRLEPLAYQFPSGKEADGLQDMV